MSIWESETKGDLASETTMQGAYDIGLSFRRGESTADFEWGENVIYS